MQVAKFRARQDELGLVPAGRYFQQLAQGLRDANAREAELQAKLDAEDARLEARYRRPTPKRTYARSEAYAEAV